MPSPRKFTPDYSATTCRPRKKRGRPAKRQCVQVGATVSQATTERLLAEAFACYGTSVQPEVLKAWVEDRLRLFLSAYPSWFGHTPSADSASRAKTRRYMIERGLIQPNEVPKGLAAKRRAWADLTLDAEGVSGESLDAAESSAA